MRYMILGFVMVISISWFMLQLNDTERNLYEKIQIHGKVQGLEGNIILNIQDNYLMLSALDRFSFVAQVAGKENLTMRIIEQPKNQYCEIFKSTSTSKSMLLNIICQNIKNSDHSSSVVTL